MAVVGVGALAEALVVGLCSGVDRPPRIVLSPRNVARSAALATRFASVSVAPDNQSALDAAPVVIVSVRPQDAASVLTPLRFRAGHAVISVMAGVSLAELRTLASPATDVVRTIPMPSVATRSSSTPVHPATAAVRDLFDRLGGTIALDSEAGLDVVSVSTATVSAHLTYVATIAAWMVERGIAPDQARRLLAEQFATVGAELVRVPDLAGAAAAHRTAGGYNEAFERGLVDGGLVELVRAGLDANLRRATGR